MPHQVALNFSLDTAEARVGRSLTTHAMSVRMVIRLLLWKRAITRDPGARSYTDLALTPVRDDDDMALDLLTKTTGARAAVAHINKVNELTGAIRAAF